MAAHRYWRALSLEAYGFSGLDISEFQLMAGATRVDASATLTSNIAPATGSLANLKDDAVSTGATWSAAALKSLVLSWDFGSGGDQDVGDIRLGSSTDATKFLLAARLQYSDDAATWVDAFTSAGMVWPGIKTKTTSLADTTGPNTVSLLHLNGANASTTITDVLGKTWTVQGNAQISTASPIFVGQSLLLDGTGDWIQTTSGLSDFAFGTGDFLVECRFRTTATKPQVLIDFFSNSGTGRNWQLWLNAGRVPDWYGGGSTSGSLLTSNAGAASLSDVHHLLVRRLSGVTTMFYDGVPVGSFADANDYSNVGAGQVAVGAQVGIRSAVLDFQGSIDEVRIVKGSGGVQRYPFNPALMGEYDLATKYAVTRAVYTRPVLPVPIPTAAGNIPVFGVHRAIPARYRARPNYLVGGFGQYIGRLVGTTKDKGSPNVPVSERVRLYRQQDGMLMRELWSTAGTGAYVFEHIDELETYTVISYDHDGTFRAVVADGLNLANGGVELMP
jgi:hypothetical protein